MRSASRSEAQPFAQHGAPSSWAPTKAFRPYRVLDAVGLVDDFYSSSLSFGQARCAALLGPQLILFDPESPKQFSSVDLMQQQVDGLLPAGSSSRFTCVDIAAFSQQRDDLIFAGTAHGAGLMYALRPDGQLALAYAANLGKDTESQMLLSSASTAQDIAMANTLHGVAAVASSEHLPHVALFGTASGTASIVDVRVRPGPNSTREALVSGDRVCSVAWNATGSIFAAGCNDSTVKIYSLANMATPLCSLDHVHQQGAVRALDFHPTHPFELCTGGGVGDGLIATHNIVSALGTSTTTALSDDTAAAAAAVTDGRSNEGRRSKGATAGAGVTHRLVATQSQVCQVKYSADGEHIVSTHGFRALDLPRIALPSSATGSVLQGSVQWPALNPNDRASPSLQHHQHQPKRHAIQIWRVRRHSRGLGSEERDDDESSDGERRRTGTGGGLSTRSRALETHQLSAAAVSFLECGDSSRSSILASLGPEGHRDGDDVYGLERVMSLEGHTARPLHLCRQRGPTGVFASAAGGDDSTIRFWRLFSSSSSGGSPPASRTASGCTTGMPSSLHEHGDRGGHEGRSCAQQPIRHTHELLSQFEPIR